MSDINTKLIQALLENRSVDDVFRQELENTINQLLKAELSSFLGYEKYSSAGWHSGNSRNGFYQRDFRTEYGVLHLQIPRDRNGKFQQKSSWKSSLKPNTNTAMYISHEEFHQ